MKKQKICLAGDFCVLCGKDTNVCHQNLGGTDLTVLCEDCAYGVPCGINYQNLWGEKIAMKNFTAKLLVSTA